MDYLIVYASSVYSSTGVVELFLVTAFLFWYFNPSLRGMMDVITANFYQKYSGAQWSGPGSHEAGVVKQRLTQNQNRRRERLKDEKDLDTKTEEAMLYSAKSEPWDFIEKTTPRPLVGLSCNNCTPLNAREEAVDSSGRVVNVLNVSSLPGADGSLKQGPAGNFLSRLFKDVLHCITFRSYDYPYIYDTVLKDETLRGVIEDVAQDIAADMKCQDEDTFIKILSKQRERAVKLLTTLRSTLSDFIIRVSAWVFLKTLPVMFSSLSIPPGQIAMLKRANASGLPLIFLPLHRSHMDYIAVTVTLVTNDIKAPLVAAGENLNIPVFGWILRGLGAFFIKRRMDPVTGKKDKVYRSVLHTYMNQCIAAGHNFEFFIEGRRSRTGKPSMPKGGLLSIFIDAYLNGTLTDALLVPVSINCEKLVDDSFLNELSGSPKHPESFTSTVSAIWSAFTATYGHIRIDFNQPFSLNELVKSFQSRMKSSNGTNTLHMAPSTASLYGTDVVVEEERQLVDSIARHILYDGIRSTAVMSTNAVSFLLLYVYRDGATLGELASALDILRSELRAAGRDTGFTGDSLDVVNHAVSLLGPGLVHKEKRSDGEFLRPVTILPNVLELSYYSNILLPHFILEATISLSLLSLSQEPGRLRITHDELIDTCLSLCQILQFEFLFTKTCQNLTDALHETIDNMVCAEIITVKDRPSERFTNQNRNMDLVLDDEYDDDDIVDIPSITYHVNTCNSKLLMYSGLIRPLIDTYSVTAHCLHTLIENPSTEKDFIKYSLSQVRTRVDNNTFKYGESVSTETITNSVRLFEKLNVIEGFHQDGVKVLSINTDSIDSTNPSEIERLVQPIVDEIYRFQITNILT